MPLPPGTVILDANAFGRLQHAEVRGRIERSLRAANLQIWPTAINALEIVRHENPATRSLLLRIGAELSGTRYLLPHPKDLLKRVAGMIESHGHEFDQESSDYEWILHEPERITEQHVAEAGRLLDEHEARFAEMHRRGRRAIRNLLRKLGGADPWGSIPAFLDQQWTTPDMLGDQIRTLWQGYGFEQAPDVERVLANDTFRLYFEGVGATVYERAVLSQSPRPAHIYDLVQFVYLTGTPKSILVTDDVGFARVARAVLEGRYRNTRVMSVNDFIAAAP